MLCCACCAVLCCAVLCCAVRSRHSKDSRCLLPAAGGRLGPGHTASHARPLLRLAPLRLIGWLRGLGAKHAGACRAGCCTSSTRHGRPACGSRPAGQPDPFPAPLSTPLLSCLAPVYIPAPPLSAFLYARHTPAAPVNKATVRLLLLCLHLAHLCCACCPWAMLSLAAACLSWEAVSQKFGAVRTDLIPCRGSGFAGQAA